jgi:DNA-binding IclR family transcriptional regulator
MKSIQSIERAAAILRLLSGPSRRMGVAEIAGELDLAKATAHGILRTLVQVGYVEQDPESGKYQLGAALLHIGSSYLDGNELRTRALNWSDSLASRTNESVRIGTLHDRQVLVVHHVFRPDDTRQVLEVGALLPAHASALGKMLLAHHGYAAAECIKAGLPRYTRRTIVDAEELLHELEVIKQRGWAVDLEELVSDEAAYAAPIKDRRGDTVGAIGIQGPADRLCVKGKARSDLAASVREAARSISRELGAKPG